MLHMLKDEILTHDFQDFCRNFGLPFPAQNMTGKAIYGNLPTLKPCS